MGEPTTEDMFLAKTNLTAEIEEFDRLNKQFIITDEEHIQAYADTKTALYCIEQQLQDKKG